MSKLYVTNVSRQRGMFVANVAERGRITMELPIGRQMQVGGDLNPIQIESILQHFAKYGIGLAEEALRDQKVTPWVFSLDRPLKQSQIELLMNQNEGLLVKRGQDMRRRMAVAINSELDRHVQQLNRDFIREGMRADMEELEITVTEQPTAGGKPDGDNLIQEGVLLDKSMPERAPPVITEKRPRSNRHRSG